MQAKLEGSCDIVLKVLFCPHPVDILALDIVWQKLYNYLHEKKYTI